MKKKNYNLLVFNFMRRRRRRIRALGKQKTSTT
jgi:hypothetical protein